MWRLPHLWVGVWFCGLVDGRVFLLTFWYLTAYLKHLSPLQGYFFHFCAYLQFVLPHGFIVFSCLNLKMYDSNVCHPDEAWCLAICKQITAAIWQSQHLNVLYWSSIDLVVDKYKLNFCSLLPHSWLDSKCFNLFQITNYFTVTLPLTCVCWRCGRLLFYTSKTAMLSQASPLNLLSSPRLISNLI